MVPPKPRRIAFVVTDLDVLASHIPAASAAAAELGLESIIVTAGPDGDRPVQVRGARIVPLGLSRTGGFNPMSVGYGAGQLAAILRQIGADLVHCIGPRAIVLGGIAAAMAGISPRVYALNGLGELGARQDLRARFARKAMQVVLRGPLASRRTRVLFENEDDPRLLGLDPADRTRVTITGGPGIDPDALHLSPLPALPPLRIALVAHMVWSQGIDLAVEAIRLARAGSVSVELSLFGKADGSGSRAVSDETLRTWSREPGIHWHGAASDMSGIWRNHHAACLPSRGGEGMPPTLLDAAAHGRAIVTTDVPGCRRFVRDGQEGFVVPPDDAQALAAAFTRLASDRLLPLRMGAAARARIFDGFTEREVAETLAGIYGDLLRDARTS